MALTNKERELVAVGASIAAGCKPCARHHFKKVRGAGASDEEIEQSMMDAVAVRDEAKRIMEHHGLKLLGVIRRRAAEVEDDAQDVREPTRIGELVSVASAFIVNCTSSLEKHLAGARSVGVTDDEIQAVTDLAKFIKGQADSLCCKLI